MQWIDDNYRRTRRDRREEQQAERYNVLFEIEDGRRRREWQEEFDSIPYRSNGADIHRIVMQRMAMMKGEGM